MSDIDFGVPTDILDDWYSTMLDEIASSNTIPLRIHYKTDGIFDKVSQTWTSPAQNITLDVTCSYREVNKIGDIESSQIIQGVGTGNYKIFIPYANRIDIDSITNYVKDSLYFTLRPNSNPITLYVKTDGITYEYLLDNENYPLTQKILCSVTKGA